MIIRRYRRACLIALCLLLLAPACLLHADSKSHAHDPYALLFGTVDGPNDLPAYGVRITIRRADQKRPKWELTSDHQGEFAQRVPAGKADYVITANVKTSKGAPKPEVTVHVEKDERKDFVLHLK